MYCVKSILTLPLPNPNQPLLPYQLLLSFIITPKVTTAHSLSLLSTPCSRPPYFFFSSTATITKEGCCCWPLNLTLSLPSLACRFQTPTHVSPRCALHPSRRFCAPAYLPYCVLFAPLRLITTFIFYSSSSCAPSF